jgi:hypothetical protein
MRLDQGNHPRPDEQACLTSPGLIYTAGILLRTCG